MTRKIAQSKVITSSKVLPSSIKQTPKAVERRFPLHTNHNYHEQENTEPTYIQKSLKQQQHPLRRRQSIGDQRSAYTKAAQSVATHDHHGESEASGYTHDDGHPRYVAGVSLPEYASYQPTIIAPELATSQSRMQSFIRHGPQPPQQMRTPDLKPPTPGFMRSHSTSTGLSESPGPFSNYSRESTPTSISSASPALSHIPKFPTRRTSSPTRSHPPIARRKVGELSRKDDTFSHEALSSVRETPEVVSTTSSIKTSDLTLKKKLLRKVPPNPPQRVSSKSAIPTTSIDSTIALKRNKPIGRTEVNLTQSISATHDISTSRLVTPKSTQSRIAPPRPSREGTPNLEGFGRSPQIQNNLTQFQIDGSKALETPQSTSNHPAKVSTHPERHQPRSRYSSEPKKVQPRPGVTSPHLVSRDTSKSRGPPSTHNTVNSRLTSREPSPSLTNSSKPLSRFSLFSRKLKSPLETTLPDSSDKANRKGPAAGTGHEGYGKYGRRGRSSSTSTAASRARSTSTESNSFGTTRISSSRKSSFNSTDGQPELDDFLKDRLEPVVIGGGGQIKENRNSGAGHSINTSNQGSTTSVDSFKHPRVLYRQTAKANDSCSSMADSIESTTTSSIRSGLSPINLPTLAHRRSLLRAQTSGESSGKKLPKPINTKGTVAPPGPGTYDSTFSTAPPTDASSQLSDMSEGHEGQWLRPKKTALVKPKRTRKWNIFHRRQRSNDSNQGLTLSRQSSNEQHALGMSGFDTTRPIAHYAISDDFESDQAEDIEDRLRHIEVSLGLDAEEYGSEFENTRAREPSVLLPSPPKFQSHFEPFTNLGPDFNTPNLANVAINRPPRLQQIGRIPRVVSKRDRVHRPSPQSFSRPFARQSDTEDNIDATLLSQFPLVNDRTKLELRNVSSLNNPLAILYGKSSNAPPTNGMLYNLDGEQEFLHFSPRKGSEVSTDNSSGHVSLAAITAMISPPEAGLSDDEVWGEFDEFLDHVTSPISASPGTPDSRVEVDYFTMSMIGKDIKSEVHASPNSSVTTIDNSEYDAADTIAPLKQSFPSSSGTEALSSTNLNTTNEDRSKTIRDSTLSTISGSQYSSQTQISRSGSRSSVGSGQIKRVTQVMAEKTRCSSTDSLRFSALMTSRWLSFDRVLFSPVQNQISSNRQDRILVVDGLGNDDWSTYCALTFPGATVHSLCSMTSRPSQDQRNPENWTPPTNHRRHTYTNVNAPFPFVKNWFSAVVFRFPAANTFLAYRHAMSECERVLRPGGYLELSVLDMDMVNMGSTTSHAVRNLKMEMHEVRPDISLSPVSDEILKLLGKKGFENVSRAIVGVPVVGMDSGSPIKTASQLSNLSFGDMLVDQAKSQNLHYPSTKAMAKAARWWWSKCYENVSRVKYESIWDDDMLLHECRARETGLKLFVCYAQKPISHPRRTVSV